MTKFIDKINELERIEITKYYTEFRDGFKEIHDWAKSEGFLNEAKLAKYEIDICSLIEKNQFFRIIKVTLDLFPNTVLQALEMFLKLQLSLMNNFYIMKEE